MVSDIVFIWNGKSFDGLGFVLRERNISVESVHRIQGNVLNLNGGKAGYLKTKEIFSNYKLHTECLWLEQNENDNNGVLVISRKTDTVYPKCIQIQHKKGTAGDLIAMSGASLKETIGTPKETASKFNSSNEKS